jgi:hypothetical protein
MSHAHPKKFFAFEQTKNIVADTQLANPENKVKIQELMYASMNKLN